MLMMSKMVCTCFRDVRLSEPSLVFPGCQRGRLSEQSPVFPAVKVSGEIFRPFSWSRIALSYGRPGSPTRFLCPGPLLYGHIIPAFFALGQVAYDLVEMMGVEPITFALRVRCSPN